MAITFDTFSANAPIATDTGTCTHTLAVGAQLWVMVIAKAAPVPGIVSVKYNGVTIGDARGPTSDFGISTVMGTYQSFESPLTGDGAPHDIVVVFDRVVDEGVIAAASFLGASTTTTLGHNTNGTSTTPSSGSKSPSAGTLYIDAVGIKAGVTPTGPGAGPTGQVLITNGNIGGFGLGFGLSYRAGGETFSMDWTIASNFWISHGLILNPATTLITTSETLASPVTDLARPITALIRGTEGV